ncbi:MAG: hypothetical protein FJW79_00280 [Actinobacteria bacterium]|nr:hypothetical protein [Actinomycetota bacterium]
MTPPRLLTIMGSGETTATMVPVHRAVFERFPGRARVAILDTPYGFQENADELTARAREFFRTSLPMARVEVASLRSPATPPARREQALDTLRQADVVFSGPGSPSYALRVWKGTPVPDILADKAAAGGAVTMASAASITLGRFSLPVYEIYKVGADPCWLEGLDVLGALGLPAAVVPHWDNAEGGTHDTSRCWLGVPRFTGLVEQLPAETTVIGVDEHTAVVLDAEAWRGEVWGKGTVTLVAAGETTVLAAGDAFPLGRLRPQPRENEAAPVAMPGTPATGSDSAALETAFAAAVAAGDRQRALDAILALEDAHEQWDEQDAARAHTVLRGMVTRFNAALAGAAPTPEGRAAVVDSLLEVRSRARAAGRWADADAIRRALLSMAVEVHDTPAGTVWEVAGP